MKSLIALALAGVLVCGIAPRTAQAQNLPATATGKSYLIAFPKPLGNLYDLRFPNVQVLEKLTLHLYSDHSTTAVITPPGGGSDITVVLNGGEFEEVQLPIMADSYVDQIGVVSGNAWRVRSRRPILVYCHMTGPFGGESWTPLPIESWGNEYYAAMIPSESIADATPASEFTVLFEAKGAPSQIVITAARDNTTVVIEPNADVEGGGGNPITVNLDAGESYMVRSQADAENPGSHDLGGTRIVANKIVGVISGNTRGSALDDATMLTGNSIRNLMIEALAPVEQHGTEFVFMPAWDARRQQPGLPADESREFEYTRVYGSSAGTTFGTITDDQGNLDQFSVTNGSFHSAQFDAPAARVIRTDQPTQAMMHPSAVVKFNGTTLGIGNAVGASYLAWSTYMVELTPREQWTKRAVFIAPTHPTASNHYINLVARADDQSGIYISPGNSPGAPFAFNRGTIPGTDLVWGTMTVNAGLPYRIEGINGERFAGFVYGSWRGYEQFRPGRARKDDDKGASPQAHPSEYEEAVALYYGYPIAARRRVLNDPDVLSISSDDATSGIEGERRYTITISNDAAAGLRSIDLAPESVNAGFKVVGIGEEETDIVGAVQAEVRVYPIDPEQDASATLIVTDRTGTQITAPFAYSTETSAVAGEGRVVSRLEIAGPNPTSGSTGIVLNTARSGNVRVAITDALGRQVALIADRDFGPGEHTLEWDASSVPAGVYFCTATGSGPNLVERIVVK